ncbi:ThuA domain-containing protein [Natronoflexus pectinivorans]|uniref:ThuA-like domain-containing protein n=1 Tax=Natronoflexus pectinivorans TaxID=682526 RepID=A0A4R2GMQ7_9BACT|nr:ThuA domain-containing protein [Natronoflexus pectinivorans]TCO10555.1 hypothetical protein EV194_101185 [Natronoflexus pectinivorans]
MNLKAIIFIFSLAMLSGTQSHQEKTSILVFTKTNDFRHDAIPAGKEALKKLGKDNKWHLNFTEDSLFFTPANLSYFDAVVFLLTSGDILGSDQQNALRHFVESGGGLVTIHTGTVTENNWPWFVEAVGAMFTGHPPVQEGKLIIEDPTHPATSFLPDSIWILEDEWYSFDRNPRGDVHVLISIDEDSYDVDDNRWFPEAHQRMGDHPLVWYKIVGEGRVFQTALGHVPQMYADSLFLQHLKGAIEWGIKKSH